MIARTRTILSGFDPEGPFAGMVLPEALRKRQAKTRFIQRWRWKQRGSIIMVSMGTAEGGIVVLTAHTDTDLKIFPLGAVAGFEFQRDGTLGRTQAIDIAGEWWSKEPDTTIGDGYEVRALSAGKVGVWDNTAAAADDVWITMTSTRLWRNQRVGIGTDTTSATFEVGLDGVESALDSATLTAVSTVDV